MATAITRPESTEYPKYYANYIGKVQGDDLFAAMQATHRDTQALIGSLTEEQLRYRYAEGKWTIKDIIGHLIDAERIFAYRALRFARKDKTDLPGFDENEYVPASNANERNIHDLLAEFTVVRASTLSLLKSFSEEMLTQIGTANQNPISVRSLAYIIGGHEMHHLAVIKERYLK
ncbi:MAG: DinB family protein [Ignavibacteria bacterium]|nr:DinB family protein [Ignavibacteria bacterium]MBL7990879.1 DinB family protein [Candidatus Kapabacteria bacterium]